MKKLHNIIILLCLLFSFGFSNDRFYESHYTKSQIGFGAHIAGSTLQNVVAPALIAKELSQDNDGLIYMFMAGGTFLVGTAIKMPADISLGVNATRVSRRYDNVEEFSWRPYFIGLGTFCFAGIISEAVTSDVGMVLCFGSYVASEVFFTIHAVRAVRTTRGIVEDIQKNKREVSFGLAPIFSQNGNGMTLVVSF